MHSTNNEDLVPKWDIPNQSNLWTDLGGYKKDKFTLFIVQFQGKLADMYTSLQSSRLA